MINVSSTNRLVAALVVALGVGIAGCGSSGPMHGDPAKPSTRHAERSPTTHIEASVATSYTSLTGLRRDAAAIAVIVPTGATSVETIAGVPWTLSTVAVRRVITGGDLPASFRLRQLGAPDGVDGAPLVSSDKAYLAYLTPFTLGAGPVSDEWVAIGGLQGLFERPKSAPATSDDAEQFSRVDSSAGSLPEQVSLAQAASK